MTWATTTMSTPLRSRLVATVWRRVWTETVEGGEFGGAEDGGAAHLLLAGKHGAIGLAAFGGRGAFGLTFSTQIQLVRRALAAIRSVRRAERFRAVRPVGLTAPVRLVHGQALLKVFFAQR
jgi:hypothetical protein